jgi:hypothetical protein
MKISIIIGILFIALSVESNMADPPFIYSLNQTFKLQVFIPYYSYFTMVSSVRINRSNISYFHIKNLEVLPTDDLIVSNTSFTIFNLTNGTLLSDFNQATYFLKNQTGSGYPPYILKRGQAKPTDASIFRASRDTAGYGRFISPEIEGTLPNGWIACNTTNNMYSIGWDSNVTSQPREGCINIAKYIPGVLLHVGYI